MKVYERLADAFIAEGTSHVFGMMGDGNMYWMNALIDRKVNCVEVRHEGVGMGMADGWARHTTKPGVATATCGPGVTQLATSFTASVSTSPTIIVSPFGPVTWLIPMSITAAPGLTMSARRNFGLPTATSTASARRECAATERVMWWHTVTVAPSAISMNAAGFPTISE